jgi:hypothetical protein
MPKKLINVHQCCDRLRRARVNLVIGVKMTWCLDDLDQLDDLLARLLRWQSMIARRYMMRWIPCMCRKMGSPIKNRKIS